MRHLIDLKALKERASFGRVLDRYGLGPQNGRHRHFILCPFHREKTASCMIDHVRKRFRCFGCGAGGTILDFVARLEHCSIGQAAAALTACCGDDAETPPISDQTDRIGCGGYQRHAATNPPLGFSLRLAPSHPYLIARGLTAETVERFGLGYCDRGVMRGRIAIPLHDEQGRLVAYAGRWAAATVPKDRPRYLLPRDFRKQLVLYNLNRVRGAATLIVVESYWSVFRLSALDVPAIGLMGRELSEAHVALLRKAAVERVCVMLDGDISGRAATAKIIPELARHFFVRTLELPDGMKPHSAPEETLRTFIAAL